MHSIALEIAVAVNAAMFNKGKVGKRKVSKARKSAPKATIDHVTNSQRSDTPTPPESFRNLHSGSRAEGTDSPPSQLARDDAQSTPYYASKHFYAPCRQGRLVLDQPYHPSMHGHVSEFWVHPSIKDAIPSARRSMLLDQYKNIPSPRDILTSQYPNLPFDNVSLPSIIDSASHPRENSSMAIFYLSKEQSVRFETKTPDSDANSDYDNNGGRSIPCHENRGYTRVPPKPIVGPILRLAQRQYRDFLRSSGLITPRILTIVIPHLIALLILLLILMFLI